MGYIVLEYFYLTSKILCIIVTCLRMASFCDLSGTAGSRELGSFAQIGPFGGLRDFAIGRSIGGPWLFCDLSGGSAN